MVYVTALLERLSFIKKLSGLISKDDIGVFFCVYVCETRGSATLDRDCGLQGPCTCEAQCHSCTPDMSSLHFSTEDIPTGRDRTLRTVAPAGTVHASSTGTRTDVSSREAMHIYRLFYM